MAKPSLKLPSNPFHPSEESPATPHTRQASLNIARSPLISPSSSSYIPSVSSAPLHSRPQHGRKGSYVPINGLDRTSEEIPRKPGSGVHGASMIGDEGGDEMEGEELERDMEAMDVLESMRGADEEAGEARYEGPFQPPVGNEMAAIWASFVGVLVLAVAAGFTTVYDWVL